MAIDVNISTTFLGNTDTPSTYVGQGSKVVSVKVDETGLEFTTVAGGGNIYNTDGTLTGNRTVTGGGFSLTFNTSPIALGFYINGNSTRNFYVNQFGAGDAIFAQATTGFVADFLGGNGTAVRIQSQLVGLNCSGNAIGGFFKPLAAGGTGLQCVQDVGAYAFKTTGKINCSSLPTSSAGLSAGDIWNDLGTLKIV